MKSILTDVSHSIFNEFFVASDDVEVLVVVEIALVAGVQPAIDDRLRRCLYHQFIRQKLLKFNEFN